jgi:catechol 2,3-dioxygenase-like lactoylglutathione lyase family enzyme
VTAFSHVGICVSDLEASVRFYTEALGFEVAEGHTIGSEFGRLMDIDGPLVLHSQFLSNGGVRIELLRFETPEGSGPRERRPMTQFGLTHLSMRVDDVAGVAERVRAYGGTVVEDTRTTLAESLDFLYCTDPDGTRIELMALPGSAMQTR